MEQNTNIYNELIFLKSSLATKAKPINVYTVPLNYFEQVTTNVFSKINENKTAILVPDGYFNNLSTQILNKIKEDELDEFPPILQGLKNIQVFKTPVNYFKNNENVILQKIKQKASIFNLKTIVKYAVAAALVGIVAFGGIKYIKNNTVKNNLSETVLAGIKIANDNKVDDEIAKLSDADIVNYLEKNEEGVDNLSVVNAVDENELPEQHEYFENDKTLENYLNKLNDNQLKNE